MQEEEVETKNHIGLDLAIVEVVVEEGMEEEEGMEGEEGMEVEEEVR